MKKALMTCLAIVAVFAIASSAAAITCTVDQRPAATLLVPYFQVSYDASGALVPTGIGARDVIVTIGNASAAPTLAHVAIWDRNSNLVLDFMIALTGYDLESMRLSDVFAGTLPTTKDQPYGEVCQRNPAATVYPNGSGFLRVKPANNALTPDVRDNRFASTAYPIPAFGSSVSDALIHNLRVDCAGVEGDLAIGYMTIDMANYCTLSNPDVTPYYTQDALGMENSLWGEIIFTSGFGLPTYAMSTVNLEANLDFGGQALATTTPVRTYYARYWNNGLNGNGGPIVPPSICPNCSASATPPYTCGSGDDSPYLDCNAPWDVSYGDGREPLGLRYAARWFDLDPTITSNFRIWRAGLDGAGNCDVALPPMVVTFFDGDENTTSGPGDPACTSPPTPDCGAVSNLAPYESQQLSIKVFDHPSVAGWVDFRFYQTSANGGTVFDQAWVDYSFEGAIALESILVPGTQLDPSSCNPIVDPNDLATQSWPIVPAIPSVPAGTGL